MADTLKQVFFGQLASSLSKTKVYTVPTGTQLILKNITISNTRSSDTHVGVWLVPNGQTSSTFKHRYIYHSLPGQDILMLDCSILLNAGDFIELETYGSGVTNFSISGMEVT